MDTALYLVFTGGYCSLLVVTASYYSLLLIPTFSMNKQLHLSWIMCCQLLKDQYIPKLDKIRDQDIIMESSVHYLPCLDTPATEYAAIIEVMNRALKTKESLKLSEIVCVFELCIFVKAAEIMEGSF